ncbi:Uncharacterised protein [uncultured archaeon]|nr:Uncharacterised protein [uncultured archaeon]
MGIDSLHIGDDEAASRMLLTVAAEVLYICAVVLILFVYLPLPIDISTGAAIAALFIGSLFCWKSYSAAQIMLVLSLLASEVVLYGYFDWILIPAILLDIAVIISVARAWQMKD